MSAINQPRITIKKTLAVPSSANLMMRIGGSLMVMRLPSSHSSLKNGLLILLEGCALQDPNTDKISRLLATVLRYVLSRSETTLLRAILPLPNRAASHVPIVPPLKLLVESCNQLANITMPVRHLISVVMCGCLAYRDSSHSYSIEFLLRYVMKLMPNFVALCVRRESRSS